MSEKISDNIFAGYRTGDLVEINGGSGKGKKSFIVEVERVWIGGQIVVKNPTVENQRAELVFCTDGQPWNDANARSWNWAKPHKKHKRRSVHTVLETGSEVRSRVIAFVRNHPDRKYDAGSTKVYKWTEARGRLVRAVAGHPRVDSDGLAIWEID